MRELSKSSKALLAAVEKGYTISKEGLMYGPRGNLLKQRTRNAAAHKDHKGNKRLPYYVFSVKLEGVSYSVDVHRFQAYKKFGDALFEEQTVRHLDGCSLNNHWDNIAIGSFSDNSFDRPAESRQTHAQKAANAQRTWTDQEVLTIRRLRREGLSLKELRDRFGGSHGQLSDAIHGKTYKGLGDGLR